MFQNSKNSPKTVFVIVGITKIFYILQDSGNQKISAVTIQFRYSLFVTEENVEQLKRPVVPEKTWHSSANEAVISTLQCVLQALLC